MARGYWGCVAIACEVGKRRVTPLHQRLWSAQAPDFESENLQLLEIIGTIRGPTHGRGVYVMDRGGDRIELFAPLLERGLRFVVRLVGDRHLEFRRRLCSAAEIARDCPRARIEALSRRDDHRKVRLQLAYGYRPVKLPGRSGPLFLVVVRGFGTEPLMLLTNVAVLPSRSSLAFIVHAYLSRWLVEESIRFIKQSYRLEDLRVLAYERLKNLVTLVLAAAYFSAVWLGESVRLSILTANITSAAKRLFGVPDFHYCAVADGISVLLARLARWRPSPLAHSPPPLDPQFTLAFPD